MPVRRSRICLRSELLLARTFTLNKSGRVVYPRWPNPIRSESLQLGKASGGKPPFPTCPISVSICYPQNFICTDRAGCVGFRTYRAVNADGDLDAFGRRSIVDPESIDHSHTDLHRPPVCPR